MTEPATVLIVEDDPATRERLSTIVAGMSGLRLLAAVGTCEEARAFAETPDVVLVDLGLPDGSGVDLIGDLHARHTKAEIVVITMFGDERNVIRSIENGAAGYLLKGGERAEIEQGLRELLAGGSPVSPAIARHVLRRLQPPPERPAPDAVLTERETEVLSFVAKGFTFVEIAGFLDISTHTVTTHMRRVYGKLEVRSKSEAVYEAAHLGLISLDRERE